MVLSEQLRSAVFWALDFLKGGSIRKHIKDLELSFSDPRKGKQIAEHRLQQLLDHATTTTPYYKQYAGKQIHEFPVVQKCTIREYYNDFLSHAYHKYGLISVATSGSYGTPLKFLITNDKRTRQLADYIFFNRWAGYEVGKRHIQIRVYPRSRLWLLFQNAILLNPSVINQRWLDDARNVLKSNNICCVIAYVSALMPITEYCRCCGDGPSDFNIASMICSGEPLPLSIQNAIENVFGCPVLDRYSTNELGVIAHECPASRRLHVNYPDYYVEILKMHSDERAESGEYGRIVITDLFSHAMPLIRYDIGDVSSWAKDPCDCGLNTPIIEKISGRITELIYDPEGQTINPMTINRETKYADGIKQFQFIQKSSDVYHIILVVSESFDQEALLKERFLKLLGPKANLVFEYVDTIEPLPSGKRPYVINQFRNTT